MLNKTITLALFCLLLTLTISSHPSKNLKTNKKITNKNNKFVQTQSASDI